MKRVPGACWILATLFACSRPGPPRTADPADAGFVEYRGKVVVTGSEPTTSVSLVGSEGNLELVGSLEPELRRLAGAGLRVTGSLQGRRPAQSLDVKDYEITDIDGGIPATGILRSERGRLLLDGRDTVDLVGVPEALRGKTGAKIWIIGKRSGSGLTVQSYGIIKER